jgi:RNA polymerase sigma factor (sigma-70 family)
VIAEAIIESKNGSSDAMLLLVQKFDPLLKSYTKRLYYEDAYYDLLLGFVEIVMNLNFDRIKNKSESVLVSYINVSMKNLYIRISKSHKLLHNMVNYSSLTEQELYQVECADSASDVYFKNDLIQRPKMLSNQEYEVLKMLFQHNIPITTIAKKYGITRQAINQTKNRAIKKLRRYCKPDAVFVS